MRLLQKFSPSFSTVPGTLGVLNKYMLTDYITVNMKIGETKNNRGSIERREEKREKG